MKKAFFAIAIVTISFAACNSDDTKTNETKSTDTTTVVTQDTAKVVTTTDTTVKVTTDTTKMEGSKMADTTKKK